MPGLPRFLLIDRDGVINRDRDDYVKSLDDLDIFPFAPDAIARATAAGFAVAVVSNQQGIGKGLISEEDLNRINEAISLAVLEAGGDIAAFVYCPHLASDECSCRKPRPGMILSLREEFGFALDETYYIGDKYSDLLAARAAGCGFVLVLTGDAKAEDAARFEFQPDQVCADMSEAVDWVIRQSGDPPLHPSAPAGR